MAFDAVARHESLTRAAGALCLSLSAISKQLSSLESFLGQQLLQKKGRSVELTPTGRDYWMKISPSLRVIESATFEARSGVSGVGVLTLACAPTFLTRWLIPRLPDFRAHCPGAMFSFRRHLDVADGQPPDIDAAIRYGVGDWSNVTADYITGREFICICAPKFLQAGDAPRTPRELFARATLLHHVESPMVWRKWAATYGLNEMQTLAGPRFAQYSALIQAVQSGLGIGLAPRVLVMEELLAGRLVSFGEPIDGEHGHYLCFSPDKLKQPVFAVFRAWLLAQGAAQRGQEKSGR